MLLIAIITPKYMKNIKRRKDTCRFIYLSISVLEAEPIIDLMMKYVTNDIATIKIITITNQNITDIKLNTANFSTTSAPGILVVLHRTSSNSFGTIMHNMRTKTKNILYVIFTVESIALRKFSGKPAKESLRNVGIVTRYT